MSERCPWCGEQEIYVSYHDSEWGVPVTDSKALWGKLILDGFQAGLSWLTILKKRDAFARAFDGLDPEIVAGYGPQEVARLLADPGIVRHRGKIEAAISNARAWQEIEREQGFERFLWRFVGFRPLVNRFERMEQVPASTPLSAELSRALKGRGFRFCGPTIVYAFMQAVGMVNDHLTRCPRHAEVQALSPEWPPGTTSGDARR